VSILHAAAARGDIETVQRLLNTGSDVNRTLKQDGATPLIYAAADRRAGADMLRLLVERGADPFATTDNNRQTALHAAAKTGHLENVHYLLSLGIDVNQRDAHGYSPILFAAYSKSPEKQTLLRALLDAGANPYRPTDYKETAVSACASDFDLQRLFEREQVTGILRWTPLMAATAWDSVADMESLLRQPQDFQRRDGACRTAWHIAIETGDTAKAKLLYAQEEMPMGDEVGLYPNVFYAIRHDHHTMLDWLITIGADIHARDRLHTTMEYAALCGASTCLQLLIEQGVTEQAVLDDALSTAANVGTITPLLAAGADIDHVDGEGYSALKTAVEDGDRARVEYLLQHGANPNHTHIGDTPLIRAVSGDTVDIVDLLLDAGADPNLQTNPDMWFALQYVRSEQVLQVLLDAGADPTLSDAGGKTADKERWDERLAVMILSSASD
jgi:ankyrin repeat protein